VRINSSIIYIYLRHILISTSIIMIRIGSLMSGTPFSVSNRFFVCNSISSHIIIFFILQYLSIGRRYIHYTLYIIPLYIVSCRQHSKKQIPSNHNSITYIIMEGTWVLYYYMIKLLSLPGYYNIILLL